jgi:hypothetical protein
MPMMMGGGAQTYAAFRTIVGTAKLNNCSVSLRTGPPRTGA